MKISNKSKAALTALRDRVQESLDLVVKSSGNLEAMQAEEAKLNDEIAAIEAGTTPASNAVVEGYGAKKDRLALLRGRIDRLDTISVPQMTALANSMSPAHEVIAPAMEPVYREMVNEIARIIHPFYGEWSTSLRRACEMHKAMKFANFYLQRRYAQQGTTTFAGARELLAVLDALIKGEDIMPFRVEEIPAEPAYYFPWESPSSRAIEIRNAHLDAE